MNCRLQAVSLFSDLVRGVQSRESRETPETRTVARFARGTKNRDKTARSLNVLEHVFVRLLNFVFKWRENKPSLYDMCGKQHDRVTKVVASRPGVHR